MANELVEKIKVFSNDDDCLKKLGELLGNDTSRKIIRLLIENEMYTNEIANTLNLRVSLVIHHLKKMEDLGLLEITHKQIVRKGNQHRYFRMVPGLFVLPNETREEIKNKGLLEKIFNQKIKFGMISGAAVFSFLMFDLQHVYNTKNVSFASDVPFLLIPSIIIGMGFGLEILLKIKKWKN